VCKLTSSHGSGKVHLDFQPLEGNARVETFGCFEGDCGSVGCGEKRSRCSERGDLHVDSWWRVMSCVKLRSASVMIELLGER
jgi:hypothetical protein